MNDIRYKIVLDGVPLPNVTPQALQANLAHLFKISKDKAQQLMGRTGIIVKRNLIHSEAERYLFALHKAGAVCRKEAEVTAQAIMEPENSTTVQRTASDVSPPAPSAPPLQANNHEAGQEHSEEFVLLNPYSVYGRIGRLRYFAWMTVIILSLLTAFTPVMAVIHWMTGTSSVAITAYTVMGTLAFLLLSFFSICSTSQRLHDIGYSAWFALIGFIPVVNWIFSFVLCFWPGEPGENAYGLPSPANGTAVHVLAAVGVVVPILGIMGALITAMVA